LRPQVVSLSVDCEQRDHLTGRDLDNLKELHLAFNTIRDVSHLLGMHRPSILDLEENQISDATSVELFGCRAGLRSLTLSGNPVALAMHFLRHAM
jgi:Leucine-rich repeat (LRR) protein